MVLASGRDTRCLSSGSLRRVGNRRLVRHRESSALLTVLLEHTECVLTCIMAVMRCPDLATFGSRGLLVLRPLRLREGMSNQI